MWKVMRPCDQLLPQPLPQHTHELTRNIKQYLLALAQCVSPVQYHDNNVKLSKNLLQMPGTVDLKLTWQLPPHNRPHFPDEKRRMGRRGSEKSLAARPPHLLCHISPSRMDSPDQSRHHPLEYTGTLYHVVNYHSTPPPIGNDRKVDGP